MENKCESANEGICMSMLCLIDWDCGCRDKKGAPNYDYNLNNEPAKKEKK